MSHPDAADHRKHWSAITLVGSELIVGWRLPPSRLDAASPKPPTDVPHELRGMYMAALSRLTALRRWATTRNKLKEVDGKA